MKWVGSMSVCLWLTIATHKASSQDYWSVDTFKLTGCFFVNFWLGWDWSQDFPFLQFCPSNFGVLLHIQDGASIEFRVGEAWRRCFRLRSSLDRDVWGLFLFFFSSTDSCWKSWAIQGSQFFRSGSSYVSAKQSIIPVANIHCFGGR